MPNFGKKGVMLFIVLGLTLVVATLTVAVLSIISNHSRLTHHQVSRIQAQYAAKAGLIYALDKLRRNDDASWSATTPTTPPVTKTMCRSGCDINEPDLPGSIQSINITIYDPLAAWPNQGISGTRKVSATAIYTYSPS
jgi:Tfp pilus assembly protein PilX